MITGTIPQSQPTPKTYRFDETRCAEPFVRTVNELAIWAAEANRWPYSVIISVEDIAARERESAAWNPAFAWNGD
jgi:hypothetical protein